ncbi:Hypothetical protein MVR_LOCUS60 [uncultured virus]|nr:Hypothetical protein MVR_LOCUS60 [uncultured virus]
MSSTSNTSTDSNDIIDSSFLIELYKSMLLIAGKTMNNGEIIDSDMLTLDSNDSLMSNYSCITLKPIDDSDAIQITANKNPTQLPHLDSNQASILEALNCFYDLSIINHLPELKSLIVSKAFKFHVNIATNHDRELSFPNITTCHFHSNKFDAHAAKLGSVLPNVTTVIVDIDRVDIFKYPIREAFPVLDTCILNLQGNQDINRALASTLPHVKCKTICLIIPNSGNMRLNWSTIADRLDSSVIRTVVLYFLNTDDYDRSRNILNMDGIMTDDINMLVMGVNVHMLCKPITDKLILGYDAVVAKSKSNHSRLKTPVDSEIRKALKPYYYH